MPRDYARLPFTQVRRQDRAITEEDWIRAFLHRAHYGTLATVNEGQPFINSNIFVYDETAHVIYMHTARVGRTQANIDASDRICFSISEMGRLLPAEEALEFSVEYAGVMVFGRGYIITDTTEAEHGLQLLLDKYAPHLRPGRDYRPITPEELKRTAVYRIDIEQWSGKKKEAEADFPGAYLFGRHDEKEFVEYHRDGFFISTDPSKLDVDMIHEFLANEAYWASGITKEIIGRYLRHSLCYGVYAISDGGSQQIGFGRIITDFTTFAYMADVFILKAYRGQELSKWLMNCMLAHPELEGLRRWTLNTRDAHGLYHKFGFKPDPHPENYLVFRPNDPNW